MVPRVGADMPYWREVSIAAIRSTLPQIINRDRGSPLWEMATMADQAKNVPQRDSRAQPAREIGSDQRYSTKLTAKRRD